MPRPITPPRRSRRSSIAVAGAALALAALVPGWAGCSSSGTARGTGDAVTDITLATLSTGARSDAVQRAWAQVERGERNRQATRAVLKEIAWDMRRTPDDVRYTILESITSDTTPEGLADSEQLARLLLPVERNRDITALLATRAVEHGWTALTPALVRSLARPSAGDIDDLGRTEAQAIRALHPDRTVAEVVYGVFIDPQTDPGPGELRLDQRARAGAWDLLGRIDRDGTQRMRLLLETDTGDLPPESADAVEDMRAAASELRTVPRTALELEWLDRIRDAVRAGDAEAARWWAEVRDAVARLDDDQRRGLAMRHLEPVRLASSRDTAWFGRSRLEAIDALDAQLDGRPRYQRTSDRRQDGPIRSQRVDDFRDELVWADCVAASIIDTALRGPGVRATVFEFVDVDNADRSTEYGGLLIADPDGGYRFAVYPPRQRDRTSDTRFVASEDMIRNDSFALAHIHFHATRRDSSRYAGPSAGDLNTASLLGRNSVVMTSIKTDRLNPDVYQPNRVTIDLGNLERP